ncbi:MAG: hypothetical protein EOP83_20975 [Verrucomicrobiaceae bacterium]|nr:MAG: hypothetical protein EOP83_20975 [Verrucomicrobiaceae bacterium]
MNPNLHTTGQRRIAREDCEVGDWVEAIIAPEWLQQQPSHVFRREQISISPVEGGMGGILPDQSEEWTFIADHRSGGLVWVRES